jgi:hypothetical protein
MLVQEPGSLIPPPEEVLRLLPAAFAGAACFVASRFAIRVPLLSALLAALTPVVAWWVLQVQLTGVELFPPEWPITAAQRTMWSLPVLALVAAASIRNRAAEDGVPGGEHGDSPPAARPGAARAALGFVVRAAALAGAFAFVLKNFLARDPDDADAVSIAFPILLGVAVAGLQQLAIVSARRCPGFVVAGTLAFAIGHLGPVCLVHTTALHAQLAGALGLGLAFCVLPSLWMPERRVPPAFAATAVAVGAMLVLNQRFIAPTNPTDAVWGLFAAAAIAPGIVALLAGGRPLTRRVALLGASVGILLTAAAVGVTLGTAPAEEPADPDDPTSLYDSYQPR